MRYKAPLPNYTREMTDSTGRVIQTFIHCGKCMSIIIGIECDYCRQRSQKKRQRLIKFLNERTPS
jgi:hypothetical protein